MRKSQSSRSAPPSSPAPSTDRTLDIFEKLAREPNGLRLQDLAEAIGAPAGSTHRLAALLQARGYLRRDEASRRFFLTPALLRLGYAAMGGQHLVEVALEAMRPLRDDLRETVLVGALRGGEGVILAQIPGLHQFRYTVDAGVFHSLHTAAPAKAILAALPAAERDPVLAGMSFPRLTPRTLASRASFERELDRVRRDGYAVDRAEEFEGVHCVGAAVRDLHGHPAAAVWVTGPAERMPRSQFARLGARVKACADAITERLGGAPGRGSDAGDERKPKAEV
ncbi:MAG: IclR family transcriptional regulator [Lentisphaerae bacterium]|nr:IclR family transcriptional regulator [Lentisphaerota bacterium]